MSNERVFEDRVAAGRELAEKLSAYAGRDDVVVLGLPRGGVPVAFEVAKRLHAPLDVFVVRKLGAPGHEEMAIGAIASGGIRVLNRELVTNIGVRQDQLDTIEARERRELKRREELFRDDYPMPRLKDHIAILVDDGLATGATMRAAVLALKEHKPSQIIVAVPTASREACGAFRSMSEVDNVICLLIPREFRAVGLWYRIFNQTSDDEVRHLLREAREREDIPSS